MLFSSMLFLWAFLPVVFVLERICRLLGKNRASNVFLLLASLFFYAWGEPVYVLLMLASITVNWAGGLLVNRTEGGRRKLALACTVIVDLGLLGWFKYAGMFVRAINMCLGLQVPDPHVSLPIGISFFTFQAISYVVDVYRGTPVQGNWGKLALYISFFPQLVAGPIVQYADILDALENREVNTRLTAQGLRRLAYGLAKKVLIANSCGALADAILNLGADNTSGAYAWLFALAYAMQIYYDFSGYSDMAIGLGKMFGFNFKENFSLPYLSTSISEFWRRWHISLGSWFRSYVYIPLGGNRRGTARTYLNLFVVFLLTGIWHGASLSFLLWGVWHGLFIVVERWRLGKALAKVPVLAYLYTALVVLIGWVLFRTESMGLTVSLVTRMLQPWAYASSSMPIAGLMSGRDVFMLALAVLCCGPLQLLAGKVSASRRWRCSWAEIAFLTATTLLVFASIAGSTYNPFIYFRF